MSRKEISPGFTHHPDHSVESSLILDLEPSLSSSDVESLLFPESKALQTSPVQVDLTDLDHPLSIISDFDSWLLDFVEEFANPPETPDLDSVPSPDTSECESTSLHPLSDNPPAPGFPDSLYSSPPFSSRSKQQPFTSPVLV